MIDSKKIAKYLSRENISLDDLFSLLKKYNLESSLQNILIALKDIKKNIDFEKTLIIHSPYKLSEESLVYIKNYVNATHEKIEINEDKNLLAGFIAKFKNKIYDASVFSKLLK